MPETVAALLFAHMLAEFASPSGAALRGRGAAGWLALQPALVAGLGWLALGLPAAPWGLAVLAAGRLAVDLGWRALAGPGLAPFLVAQGAHLVVVVAAAGVAPEAWAAGLWGEPPAALAALAPWLARLPEAMLLGAAALATLAGGAAALPRLMASHGAGQGAGETGLPSGGRAIGLLERLLILMLVLSGEAGAIGFLIAAKSVLRFNEIRSREASEYVIIGTLASFAWAFAIAWAARGWLAAM